MWLAAAPSARRRGQLLDHRVRAYAAVADIIGDDGQQRALAVIERGAERRNARLESLTNRVAERLQRLDVGSRNQRRDHANAADIRRRGHESLDGVAAAAPHRLVEPLLELPLLLQQRVEPLRDDV